MADIIQLQQRREQTPVKARRPVDENGATLLLFTGVRYEKIETNARNRGPHAPDTPQGKLGS